MSAAPRPAVFLDRDGTLVREVDFLCDPAELELLPGVPQALQRLARAGYALVVTTNQSAIARGMIDEAQLARIHERLEHELAEQGVRLDRIDWCPHHPTVGDPPWRARCDCRKPRPGMIQRSIAALDLDPRQSWTVGDSERDLLAGAALSIPGILSPRVATGRGSQERQRLEAEGRPPLRTCEDLDSAVELILRASASQGR